MYPRIFLVVPHIMSSRVAPALTSDGAAHPKFKKPVKCTPPLTAYDSAFVKRKEQVGEQVLQLKNGRQLAYFTEGSPEDPAVLCLHGLCNWKYCWLQPKPIPANPMDKTAP